MNLMYFRNTCAILCRYDRGSAGDAGDDDDDDEDGDAAGNVGDLLPGCCLVLCRRSDSMPITGVAAPCRRW